MLGGFKNEKQIPSSYQPQVYTLLLVDSQNFKMTNFGI
jgi:hypothetical protein